MELTVASRTGTDREASDDRWVAITGDRAVLLAVADGMGGTIGGGDAATAALAALVDALSASPARGGQALGAVAGATDGTDRPPFGVPSRRSTAIVAALAAAVAAAHARVRSLAPDELPISLRAGTTLTAAVLTGRRLHLAHAGDSSCWLLRRGRVRRLTEVHTHAAALVAAGAVEQGSTAERRLGGLLTRFVGMPGTVCPQVTTVRVRAGDRVLVATDGVTRALPVAALGALLSRPDTGAAELVAAAAAAGSRDDATALLAAVDTGATGGNTRFALHSAEVSEVSEVRAR